MSRRTVTKTSLMKKQRRSEVNLMVSGSSLRNHIEMEFQRIGALNREGSRDEAWSAANTLYATHPNDATANFVIALLLVENDQKADALEYAEAAVKFAPNNVRNLVFLGKLYVDLGMIEYAPAALDKAYAIDSTAYQAPWALANYHYSSGQGVRALPYFDLALKAAPHGSKTEIREMRALCLQALGRTMEAEEEFDHIAEIPQYRISALTNAALLKKNDQNSSYAAKIRDELEAQKLNARDRSMLLLCLGRLYENGKEYDNAFLNFEKSRNLLKSDFRSADFNSQVDDNIKVLTREVFEKFSEFGNTTDKPIFIVGMPRSGTTMTERIIASHSQAEGVGELDRLPRMAASFSTRYGMQEVLDKMVEAGPVQWLNAPLQYLRLIDALAPHARHTVDKMPHNFLILGFIHLCFPNAKIIHCKRNPLDNFISAYQNPMSSFHGYSYDQAAYGDYYVTYLKLMGHWQSVLPTSIYISQYEKLTSNPEVEVRNMLEFLGLPWEDACLKFHEREATVQTFSRLQVRDPINIASVARWRNYERYLAPIMSVLEKAGVAF
jgi:tetratricopeptide (TPR) repeat protein